MLNEVRKLQQLTEEFKKENGYDSRNDLKFITEMIYDKFIPNTQRCEYTIRVSKIKEIGHIKYEDIETIYIVNSFINFLKNHLHKFKFLLSINTEPISLEVDDNYTHFIIYSEVIFVFDMKENNSIGITDETLQTIKNINLFELSKKAYKIFDEYSNQEISQKAVSLSSHINLRDINKSEFTMFVIFKSEKDNTIHKVLDDIWGIIDKFGDSVISIDSKTDIIYYPPIDKIYNNEEPLKFDIKYISFDNTISFTIKLLDFINLEV